MSTAPNPQLQEHCNLSDPALTHPELSHTYVDFSVSHEEQDGVDEGKISQRGSIKYPMLCHAMLCCSVLFYPVFTVCGRC